MLYFVTLLYYDNVSIAIDASFPLFQELLSFLILTVEFFPSLPLNVLNLEYTYFPNEPVLIFSMSSLNSLRSFGNGN